MKDVKLHHHSKLQYGPVRHEDPKLQLLVHLLPHCKSNFPFMFPASYRTNVCLWLSMRNGHLYCLLVYQFVEQNMYQSQILKKGSSLHLSVLTQVGIKLFVSSDAVKLEFWVYLLVHISVCIKLICYIFLRVHISVCIKLICYIFLRKMDAAFTTVLDN